MITDPAQIQVEDDLDDNDFRAGVAAGRWRVVKFEFPQMDFAVMGTETDGSRREYSFRAELSNYPSQAPMVRIWDLQKNAPLDVAQRPKGNPRIVNAFQCWASDTVYRPWERLTGPHNSNAGNLKHLAWRADRRLSFIFEDLHAVLNNNARARRIRLSA
jgi:hypothetical protein